MRMAQAKEKEVVKQQKKNSQDVRALPSSTEPSTSADAFLRLSAPGLAGRLLPQLFCCWLSFASCFLTDCLFRLLANIEE
jgi:hypothetical protein